MRHFVIAVVLACSAAGVSADERQGLGDLIPVSAWQQWGTLQIDRDVAGPPLRLGDQEYASGLGMSANGEVVYALDGEYDRFQCHVGLDSSMRGQTEGSIVCRVVADGRVLFDSGVMRVNDPAKPVDVSVVGVSELRLTVGDAGDGINCDHADWVDAILTRRDRPATGRPRLVASVTGPRVRIDVDSNGRIASAKLGDLPSRPVRGWHQVPGLRDSTPPVVRKTGTGIVVERTLKSAKRSCRLVERLAPSRTGIRWDVEIHSAGKPWSAPIVTHFDWQAAEGDRMWTAWADPQAKTGPWRDPLEPQPFRSLALAYGGGWGIAGGFALPLVTVLSRGAGLSLVQSPADLLLDMSLRTSPSGGMSLARTNHRLGEARVVRFHMDLVAHEADWRGGLRHLVRSYPRFFRPVNPLVHTVAGLGAYSGYEGDLDVAKLKGMGFKANWKASFDFPYMGMFLPPVPGAGDQWQRFDSDSGGTPVPGRRTFTSRKQLNDYSNRMQANSFHVLNYFNVTEFGAALQGPEQARKDLPDADLWKDATTYLYRAIPDAVLRTEAGGVYGTWGGAIAVDPGSPKFRRHLVEQARRHVRDLPGSSGICIDRTDWLAFYNPAADDGVSWRNDKPARFLLNSWRSLMATIGPMFHRAGKVIFVNTHIARPDLLAPVDGIYAEGGFMPPNFNMSALSGLVRPVIQWTATENDLKPDPDAFFQRHLYLGCFPTAPFPGNDHTINPSEWADRWYLDYGPLFDQLRARQWVLEPMPVAVVGGSAKANAFRTPEGIVVPVVFAGGSERVTVELRGIRHAGACRAWLPGESAPRSVTPEKTPGGLRIRVPVSRGCAVVVVGP